MAGLTADLFGKQVHLHVDALLRYIFMLGQALILLEGMSKAGGDLSPDVVSFNTCIKACGSADQLPQALKVPFTPPVPAACLQIHKGLLNECLSDIYECLHLKNHSMLMACHQIRWRDWKFQ